MPLYSIIARDKQNGQAHRQAVRPAHLAHLDNLGEKLIFAGPFQDEEGRSTGSFVVIEAPDLEAARDLFAQDPFVAEGVFASYEVSRWAMTINKSVGR
jgi:uncharacterized protein YciI